jgi:hypothetical protein
VSEEFQFVAKDPTTKHKLILIKIFRGDSNQVWFCVRETAPSELQRLKFLKRATVTHPEKHQNSDANCSEHKIGQPRLVDVLEHFGDCVQKTRR